MSKNITIQEGGVAKQLTVDKLKTNLVGSGTCLWVPEDEVQLTTKTITENGTYNASDDGYYGYNQVVVSITGGGTATGTDGDGDEAVAHTDPTTGDLVQDKVPSSIEVITPPTNPYGIYTDGQAITTDGMVVKAYLATGGEYGTVPNGEITLDPTTAVYDSSSDYKTADSDLATGLEMPFPFSSSLTRVEETSIATTTEIISCAAVTSYGNNTFICASASAGQMSYTSHTYYKDGRPSRESAGSHSLTSSYTYDGKTVYYYTNNNGTWISQTPHAAVTGIVNVNNIAWTMIYGTTTRLGSHQEIGVSWPRPLDGKVLETTFEILVAPGYTPNGEE